LEKRGWVGVDGGSGAGNVGVMMFM
jgi:hypothetical protein